MALPPLSLRLRRGQKTNGHRQFVMTAIRIMNTAAESGGSLPVPQVRVLLLQLLQSLVPLKHARLGPIPHGSSAVVEHFAACLRHTSAIDYRHTSSSHCTCAHIYNRLHLIHPERNALLCLLQPPVVVSKLLRSVCARFHAARLFRPSLQEQRVKCHTNMEAAQGAPYQKASKRMRTIGSRLPLP